MKPNTKARTRASVARLRNLRNLREAAGLTQLQLGEAISEEKSVISHWENGVSSPRASKLPQLAAALGVTIDQLYEAA